LIKQCHTSKKERLENPQTLKEEETKAREEGKKMEPSM
jgi:hypothetical protein